MASARRTALSTAVKQWRGIPHWSTNECRSIHFNKNKKNRDLSTVVKQWRGLPQWSTNNFRSIHCKKNHFSTDTRHDFGEIGCTVDVAEVLSTPERDFLVKNNSGEKVPISSLKGKLVGLYFCQNINPPPTIQTIKKVYEEAKSRGYDFEIVQITLHYHCLDAQDLGTDPTVSWLTVPYMDPSCRKIQSIFQCIDNENVHWLGDCLVLIHPCQAEGDHIGRVHFEFLEGKILHLWGIEGYPFTRPSIYKAECERQKREVTLQSLFPPGEGLLRSTGDGFDLVDASQLSGKRVLVLFASHSEGNYINSCNFMRMLKSEYRAQLEDNVAEESKFEVVCASTGYSVSSFEEFTKDMPWLVRPFSKTDPGLESKVFKPYALGAAAVAFNEQGKLIAKEDRICAKKECDEFRFPFIEDLEKRVRQEVEEILFPSIQCKKNYDLSTAVKQWRESDVSTAVKQCRVKGLPFSKKDRFSCHDIGYAVDVADLLFTPDRDFLVKKNGQKVKIDDLRGKTIVLFIVPLDVYYWERRKLGDVADMIDAYSELLRMGSDVEFVFVPVRLGPGLSAYRRGFSAYRRDIMSPEALFDRLFSTIPFPAIPFSDVQGPEGPVVQTFAVDYRLLNDCGKLPYWVVIDPTNKVVATRLFHDCRLFKLFGGAELHPLSHQRIEALLASYRSESRVQRIGKWDELLASDTRDFLLSSNGDKVPISSLKGKVVGLYFCENIPRPPRMQAIKKVYEEAKSRGYDFEIVQITFHYHPFNAKHFGIDPTVEHCREDVSWLTLPFKDPSCRKVQRIFECMECQDEDEEDEDEDEDKAGDSLVLIYPRQDEDMAEDDHSSKVLYEFSGAEILKHWGIEGYPFTRPSLYKTEYEIQKKEIRLQSLFPPGECLLQRPRSTGDGFDLVDAGSQLSGKRVLVLFGSPYSGKYINGCNFVRMQKSEYEAQLEDNVEEESKFEVVCVSTECHRQLEISKFDELTKDMPWLVLPLSGTEWGLKFKVFKASAWEPAAAAFNEQGELIAKENQLGEKMECHKLQFPFIDQDLEKRIGREVEALCNGTDDSDVEDY